MLHSVNPSHYNQFQYSEIDKILFTNLIKHCKPINNSPNYTRFPKTNGIQLPLGGVIYIYSQ